MSMCEGEAEEQEAATRIQKFWRGAKEKRERRMERMIESSEWDSIIRESTSQNDQLLENLRALRISKSYDIQKFETLLRLPPRDVNAFMEAESRKTDAEKMTEEDRQRMRNVADKQDRAARTLQNYFRKLHLKTAKPRIQKIRPNRRIELLEVLNERLNKTRKIVRRITGDEVQKAFQNHREKQQTLLAAQIHSDIRRACQTRPNSPTIRSRSRGTILKCKKWHEEEMKRIEMDCIKFQLDGNF